MSEPSKMSERSEHIPAQRRRRIEPLVTGLGVRLGLTSSQAYTVVTGAALALVLAVAGLPPVIDRAGAPRASAAESAAPGPAAPHPSEPGGSAPTTTSPGRPGPPSPAAPDPAAAPPSPATTVAATPAPVGEPVPDPFLDPFAGVEPGRVAVWATVGEPGAPSGVAAGPDGTVYVVTDNGTAQGGPGPSVILAFDAEGRPAGRWDVGGQPAGRLQGLTGVAVTGDGRVWVTDASTSRVLRLDPRSGAIEVVATIPDLRPCLAGLLPPPCEPGAVGVPPDLRAVLAWDGEGVLVADRGQGIVWEVTAGGAATPLVSFDDRLPGSGPTGLARDIDGSLVVAVSARLLSAPPGLASVVRVRFDSAGLPEPPSVVLDLALAETPAGVTIGETGRIYVAVPSAGVVLDIGGEHDVIRHEGQGVEPAFDEPTGITLLAGAVLVTNRAPQGPAPSWVVFALEVFDRPAVVEEAP